LAKAAHTAEKIDKTDFFHNALLDFLAAIVAPIAKIAAIFGALWRSGAQKRRSEAALRRKIKIIHFFSKKLLTNNYFSAKLFIAKIIFCKIIQ
jgi:hypothetical protein